jgi:hypothetical protein
MTQIPDAWIVFWRATGAPRASGMGEEGPHERAREGVRRDAVLQVVFLARQGAPRASGMGKGGPMSERARGSGGTPVPR